MKYSNGPVFADVPSMSFRWCSWPGGTTIGKSSSEIHPQLGCEPSNVNGCDDRFTTRSCLSMISDFGTSPRTTRVGSNSSRSPRNHGRTSSTEPVRYHANPNRAAANSTEIPATWATSGSVRELGATFATVRSDDSSKKSPSACAFMLPRRR